jgi:hypothetical protein
VNRLRGGTTTAHGLAVVAMLAMATAVTACDRGDSAKPEAPAPSASVRPAVRPPRDAAAPPPKGPPKVTVDGRGATVDDKPFDGPPEQWQEDAARWLAKRPFVAGESIDVLVSPGARFPKVLAMVSALEEAKAKAVVIHSRTHTGADVELALAFQGPNVACAPSMSIEQDLTTRVSGSPTIPRGERGVDFAKVAAAVEKRLAACDGAEWRVSAADTVPWATVFEVLVDVRDLRGDAGAKTPVLVRFEGTDAGYRHR